MTLKGSRCPKHPSQVVVGVCSACLRERLAVLVNVERLEEVDSSRSSARHSIASEPTRNGNQGVQAIGDRVFSARMPFDIEIDDIHRSTVSVGRGIALHDSRNTGTNKSDNSIFGSRGSDVSPKQGITKKTLSSLFNLDDFEYPTTKARISGYWDRKANTRIANGFKGDGRFSVSFNSLQNKLQSKSIEHEHEKSRRGSLSERAVTSKSLFSVPEGERRFSWFSSLFRGRRKKSRQKSIEAAAAYGQHNEWVDARRSWEAPSQSSWDNLRSSSWEDHRSSWEPARPSWEGLMQTPKGQSVSRGFDMLDDSMSKVRENTELECPGLQEFMSYMTGDWGNSSGTARGSTEGRKIDEENVSRSKQVVLKIGEGQVLLKTPPSDEKERPRTFLSAKALQLQRDVSTQTTPPRASSVGTDEKVFGQRRPQQHCQPHHDYEQPRAPPAWSKVLSRTFSNPRWALKLKRKDEFKEEGINVGEGDDQASAVSGSSPHGSARESTTHRSNQGENGMNKEYGAWNAYWSPLQRSDLKAQQQQKNFVQRGNSIGGDRSKGFNFSPFNVENGLLRFYLTPVRSTLGSRAKSKEKAYCTWQ